MHVSQVKHMLLPEWPTLLPATGFACPPATAPDVRAAVFWKKIAYLPGGAYPEHSSISQPPVSACEFHYLASPCLTQPSPAASCSCFAADLFWSHQGLGHQALPACPTAASPHLPLLHLSSCCILPASPPAPAQLPWFGLTRFQDTTGVWHLLWLDPNLPFDPSQPWTR